MELVAPNKAILIIGSLNANPADRVFRRDEIHTLQIIDNNSTITPLINFDAWGELGMGSMCWHVRDPYTIYIGGGSEVFRIWLKENKYELLNIPNLADIHDISVIGETLWITNTRHDQIVSYDLRTDNVSGRISLSDFRSSTPEPTDADPSLAVIDKFHCNQVFQGYQGILYVLVHAVSGRQLAKKIAQKLIKTWADGGVVDILERKRYPINLKAPHSVRLISDHYWVFDSARFKIAVFNKQWDLVQTMSTKGFGRGGDRDVERSIYYAGISETRKRYLGLLPTDDVVPNMVQVFDTRSCTELGSIQIPNIEQVNNLYCLDRAVADAFMEFNKSHQLRN